MAVGTVRWFNDLKGFGFIDAGDGGEDVFCHYSAILGTGYRSMREGQTVEFDDVTGEKGRHAENVRVIGEIVAPIIAQRKQNGARQ